MVHDNEIAEMEASNYLKQCGSLDNESMERHWKERSNGLFSFSDFIQAVYEQAGND